MKANHNRRVAVRKHLLLLPVRQRYKNESKSQQHLVEHAALRSCCQYDKDTKMKANHNALPRWRLADTVVASTTKIQKWKQITTEYLNYGNYIRCCQYDKDTKMKANHNKYTMFITLTYVVASTTKIQKWKQITTCRVCGEYGCRLLPVRQRYKNESKSQRATPLTSDRYRCCQYDKDTKMKANHNYALGMVRMDVVVASTTKIQKWKQITTLLAVLSLVLVLLPVRQRYKNESKSQHLSFKRNFTASCCQYDKDTKMKANHNEIGGRIRAVVVVASTTKIQKWKQITTLLIFQFLCLMLLPVRQRYKNESKSQHMPKRSRPPAGCCQYDKDTKMKANHNKKSVRPKAWKVVASTTKIQKWKQITTIDSLFIRTSFISLLISYNQFQSENFKQGFNSLYCHAPAFLNISKPLIRQSRLLSQFVSWHPDFFSFCQYGICYFLIQFHATNVRKLFHISKLFGVFYSAFEFLKIFNICAVVASTTKIQKWKQITTRTTPIPMNPVVVASTTKIQKRKQITTNCWLICYHDLLLPIR